MGQRIKDAQDAGIGVILFDRTIDASEDLYLASIVSDMNKEGETAVNWLADQGLDSYNIIHIQGVMGSAAQQGRTGALDDQGSSRRQLEPGNPADRRVELRESTADRSVCNRCRYRVQRNLR